MHERNLNQSQKFFIVVAILPLFVDAGLLAIF